MNKMKVLVTGSAGFVGSDLVMRLKQAGHHVTGIDIVPEKNSDVFKKHDLTKKFKLENQVFDVCIHLASAVGGIIFNMKNEDTIDTNQAINTTVLDLCKACRCSRMIFFSSINVFETNQTYGHGRLPPADQKTLYAISKAKGEKQMEEAIANFMIIRPTNLFGKNQARKHEHYGESHVIPDLLKKISDEPYVEVFGDGSQIRNFLHISDVNDFLIRNLAFSGRHYFNLRSDVTISIADLVQELIKFTQSTKEIKFKPEYAKYEVFKVKNFDLTTPRQFKWDAKVNSINEGLKF